MLSRSVARLSLSTACRPCIIAGHIYPVKLSSRSQPGQRVVANLSRLSQGHKSVNTKSKPPPDAGPSANPARDPRPVKPPGSSQSGLLAEHNVSSKEQRKADWAIVKDMAHYLWPKDDLGTRSRVGLSVALLVGAKVRPPAICSLAVSSNTC